VEDVRRLGETNISDVFWCDAVSETMEAFEKGVLELGTSMLKEAEEATCRPDCDR